MYSAQIKGKNEKFDVKKKFENFLAVESFVCYVN